MITQIYSLQTIDEALDCVAAGVDYIGLAAGNNAGLPAEISLEQGKKVFDAVRGKIKCVALTVADSPEPIYGIIQFLRPDVVHLCGNVYYADEAFCEKAKALVPGIEILQAIGITGPEAVGQAERYGAFCDTLILDSVDPGIAGIGAAGVVNDWDICAEIVRRVQCKVIVAGGLGPDNVADAVRATRPWGVDSLTRTSTTLPDGTSRKDAEKVRRFVENAQKAATDLGI